MRCPLALAVWIAMGAACGAAPDEPAAPPRPNVVLLMADDLGYGDVGFQGGTRIRTPHLDEMSANALRFTRFYAASPVCSPTRGSCLTGRSPWRFGVTSANRGHLRQQEHSMADVLRAHGYRTGHFGKWHLGTLLPDWSGKGPGRKPQDNHMTPGMAGFDEWFSTEYAVATWDPYDPDHFHGRRGAFDPRALYWQNGENVTGPLQGCDSRIVMDRALPFVRDAVAAGQPFLAVIWFHAPHAPVVGGDEYRALYPDCTEDEQHYFAAVTALDAQVGRLREALRELSVAEDTMVWFCSDNGPEGNPGPRGRSRGSTGGLRGRKRSLYEGGVRVPALLEWPTRIPEARATDVPAMTSDYFPTVLDALGIASPDPDRPLDGTSLLPLMDGRATARPQPIGLRHGKQRAWIDGRYKLVVNEAAKRPRHDNGTTPWAAVELYDLVADPAETRNLAAEEPARTAGMQAQLEAWCRSCAESAAGADY